MSTLAVSYRDLSNAANEAHSVSKKLDSYADELEKRVIKKLNKYDGDMTASLSSAIKSTNSKIAQLRTDQNRYKTYESNLDDLVKECKNVDKAVKSKVSSLTASFKESHGIRNSKVENAISYLFTAGKNKNNVRRWISDKIDEIKTGFDYLKSSIKELYNYWGGKDYLKGTLIALLEVAIGVLSIVGAILSGGALIVIIAGVVAGVIAVANGIENFINEQRALGYYGDDPAMAQRLSNQNTLQDRLRQGDITDVNNESWLNNHVKLGRGIAMGIDIVNTVCAVVKILDSAGKLLNNCCKWATGTQTTIGELGFKNFLNDFFSKIGNGAKETLASLRGMDLTNIVTAIKDFGSDFMLNLSNHFADFSSYKDTLSSIKHGLGFTKDILKDGFSFMVVFENLLAPGITIQDGIPDIDLDNIVLDDYYSIADDIASKVFGSDAFNPGTIDIDMSVMEKLSIPSNVSIDISFDIPEVNIPLVA